MLENLQTGSCLDTSFLDLAFGAGMAPEVSHALLTTSARDACPEVSMGTELHVPSDCRPRHGDTGRIEGRVACCQAEVKLGI